MDVVKWKRCQEAFRGAGERASSTGFRSAIDYDHYRSDQGHKGP